MFKKIEYTAVTALFGYYVYQILHFAQHLVAMGKSSGLDKQFTDRGIPFTYPDSYYHYYVYPDLANGAAVYLSFLFFNYVVIPQFYERHRYFKTAVFTLLTLAFMWLTFTITTHIEYVVDYRMSLIRSALTLWFLGIFILYNIIKKIVSYYTRKQETLVHDVVQKFLIAFVIWVAVLTLILRGSNREYNDLAPYWVAVVPSFVLLLIVNIYWLMPAYELRKQQVATYLIKLLFISFFVFAPFGMVLVISAHLNILVALLLWVMELVLGVPLAWYLYQQNKLRIAQLVNLQENLSSTVANLNFLQSQINPHFLFNALNTLYATALQEKSERTAEGIQKLGDMMRFMLHENNQKKIALNNEVAYLLNYIDLQKLRTQSSPDISIETDIQDQATSALSVAPMLLVPFIENAFKHGISLREPSYIRISLTVAGNQLKLDVINTLHAKTVNDPEKDHGGIGLENVKQRLQLLYPGTHQLSISHTDKEFIVELTITLQPLAK